MRRALDPDWRRRQGERVDRTVRDVFDFARWLSFVGVTRYLAKETGEAALIWLNFALSAALFAFLAGRLLLRGEVKLVPATHPWARPANLALNMGLCLVAFLVSLRIVDGLVDAVARHAGGG